MLCYYPHIGLFQSMLIHYTCYTELYGLGFSGVWMYLSFPHPFFLPLLPFSFEHSPITDCSPPPGACMQLLSFPTSLALTLQCRTVFTQTALHLQFK